MAPSLLCRSCPALLLPGQCLLASWWLVSLNKWTDCFSVRLFLSNPTLESLHSIVIRSSACNSSWPRCRKSKLDNKNRHDTQSTRWLVGRPTRFSSGLVDDKYCIFPPLFDSIFWKVEILLPWRRGSAVTWDALVLDRATACDESTRRCEWPPVLHWPVAWHIGIAPILFSLVFTAHCGPGLTKTIGPSSKDLDAVGTVYRFSTCYITRVMDSMSFGASLLELESLLGKIVECEW
jgi:hypothetical protein